MFALMCNGEYLLECHSTVKVLQINYFTLEFVLIKGKVLHI